MSPRRAAAMVRVPSQRDGAAVPAAARAGERAGGVANGEGAEGAGAGEAGWGVRGATPEGGTTPKEREGEGGEGLPSDRSHRMQLALPGLKTQIVGMVSRQ